MSHTHPAAAPAQSPSKRRARAPAVEQVVTFELLLRGAVAALLGLALQDVPDGKAAAVRGPFFFSAVPQ